MKYSIHSSFSRTPQSKTLFSYCALALKGRGLG